MSRIQALLPHSKETREGTVGSADASIAARDEASAAKMRLRKKHSFRVAQFEFSAWDEEQWPHFVRMSEQMAEEFRMIGASSAWIVVRNPKAGFSPPAEILSSEALSNFPLLERFQSYSDARAKVMIAKEDEL